MYAFVRDYSRQLLGAELFCERLCDVNPRSEPPNCERGRRKAADYAKAPGVEMRDKGRTSERPLWLRSAPRQWSNRKPHLTPCSEAVPHSEKKPSDEHDVKDAMDWREKEVERGDAQRTDVVQTIKQCAEVEGQVMPHHWTDTQHQQPGDRQQR